MKVLVIGASGNVGNYVVNELLTLNEEVKAVGRNIEKLRRQFRYKDNVEIIQFDFKNEDTFELVLKDIDRVFLMRPPHLGKPEDLYPFIDAIKKHGIKLISFLSLMGVETNTIPPHHKIEKYIEKLEIPYAHIRPGFFMQNLSGVHAVEIREKNEIFIPAGKSKTSFIDASDIGVAVATVLHSPEKYKNTAYTITGPESLDYFEIAKILSEITNREIRYTKPGYFKYRSYYIKKRGLNKEYVNVTVALYFMTRMGTAKRITNDFFELTGKKPQTFEEFAKRNIKYFI